MCWQRFKRIFCNVFAALVNRISFFGDLGAVFLISVPNFSCNGFWQRVRRFLGRRFCGFSRCCRASRYLCCGIFGMADGV